MYIYIYVFLIAANRHGNLLILIFLDERSPEERETFRFRFEGYSIIDGNVRENLHTIKDYSANNRGYIYIYIYIYIHIIHGRSERIVRPRVLSRVVIIACKWEHKSNAKFDKFLPLVRAAGLKVDRI